MNPAREIVFDTETTGLSPLGGDRVVEIGCVEMVNHVPTGRTFHVYINPERDMPEGAFAVHGLSTEFLSDKPLFAAIAADFVAFIGDARLVAHNAAFDIGFLNAELGRLGYPALDQARVVDTLALARKKHPFAPASLDALCQRYGIDNARRVKHGALLDAEILADVYVELLGGRQAALGLGDQRGSEGASASVIVTRRAYERPEPLPPRLTEAELTAHAAFVATLGDQRVWLDYVRETGPDESPRTAASA
jgi:DNA polymerase III subunit epsilon